MGGNHMDTITDDLSTGGRPVIPQIGDPVRLRNALWVVTGVDAADNAGGVRGSHVVTLRSIGEDDRGRAKRLVWEVEPGRRVLDRFDIPTPGPGQWDSPAALDAFVRAVQWGAVTNADTSVLEAPFRAGIDIKPYQLHPLMHALEQVNRVFMLLADDVGLGKTIEAGLVLQEFILRHRVANCLIICPASLVEKWQIEMRDRFGLAFKVIDTAYEREVRRTRGRHVNPLTSYPWLVTSMDWLKRDDREELIAAAIGGREPDQYPRPFDMLIVDEAHLVAPAGANYPTDSKRTRLIDHFGAYFEHRLFLTATPHNGHPESFWTLLHLLDRQTFLRDVEPADADIANVMVRRLKRHVKALDPSAPFPRRVIHPVEVTPTAEEVEGYNLLGAYLDRLAAHNDAGTARSAVRFMAETLRKRFLSSPAAFAQTIGKHGKTIASRGTLISDPTEDEVREAIEAAGDSYDDDHLAEEAATAAVSTASAAIAVDDDLLGRLEGLRSWAADHGAGQTGRAETLAALIQQVCREDSGAWSDGRLIVFTEYRDTHKWLHDQLLSLGIEPERIATMYGGMPTEQRSAVAQLFNRAPGEAVDDLSELERAAKCDRRIRILLATDTASEGIDLQKHCHDLLHFDIPYNPSRMEQRNGRIDRHGQPNPTADIYTFSAAPTSALGRDTSLETRIASKLAQVADDIGSANPLFVEDLKSAHHAAFVDRDDGALDTYERHTAERTAQVEVEKGVRELREVLANADMALTATRDRLDAAPKSIAGLVATALDLAGQPALVRAITDGLYALPGGGGAPGLAPEWTDTIPELVDRMTDTRRLVTFTPTLAGDAPDPILLHLNHPFVTHAAALLRSQVWTSAAERRLNRITARGWRPTDATREDTNLEDADLIVVAHARILITGGIGSGQDAKVFHEGVVARAARYRNGRWAQIDSDRAADRAWSARTDNVPDDPDEVLDLWEGVAENLGVALGTRAQALAERLADDYRKDRDRIIRGYEEQAARIQTSIRQRLDEIRERLSEHAGFWDADERDQLARNFDSLKDRLNTIGTDIESEIAAVRAQYETTDTFTMPIALTFLHPEEETV